MAEEDRFSIFEKGNLSLSWSYESNLNLSKINIDKLNNYLDKLVDSFYEFVIDKEIFDELTEIEFSTKICSNDAIQNLNRDFRSKDKATDVLSFALYEDIRSGEEDVFGVAELGDIFISLDKAIAQGTEFKITTEEEVIHLLTHGFLHLLGFDHEISQEEEDLMFSYEEEILKSLSINLKV
tara:strand:+ start:75114 stop:75656 length:543 start_codon:yes stop_codon:yes gene_type:complete